MAAENAHNRIPALLAIGLALLLTACGGGGGGGEGESEQSNNVTQGSIGYYGSRINADDLANVIIGQYAPNGDCNRSVSLRFRATHSGNLQRIRPFFIWSTTRVGYHSGDGGNILIEVRPDDGSSNHFPGSQAALASLRYDDPVTKGENYPLLTFASPAHLTAGQIYHLVFKNVSSIPDQNFVSLDCLFMWQGNDPAQPTLPDTDLAVLEYGGTYCNTGWEVYSRGGSSTYTPVIEMTYSDGFSQGQGYIQGYGQATSWNPKPITSTLGVREVFTVSGEDRLASSVSLRVNRTAGSSPLTIRLENSSGGLIDQGSVSVPQGLVNATHNGSSWVTWTFDTPITLRAGATYRLALSSPAGTTHTAHALQDGSSHGFSSGTHFGDGRAEYNDGTGWKVWNLWGIANTPQADLQFYFKTE